MKLLALFSIYLLGLNVFGADLDTKVQATQLECHSANIKAEDGSGTLFKARKGTRLRLKNIPLNRDGNVLLSLKIKATQAGNKVTAKIKTPQKGVYKDIIEFMPELERVDMGGCQAHGDFCLDYESYQIESYQFELSYPSQVNKTICYITIARD